MCDRTRERHRIDVELGSRWVGYVALGEAMKLVTVEGGMTSQTGVVRYVFTRSEIRHLGWGNVVAW